MKYNLTEKLKFNEDPVMVIKEQELTVKSDADVVLQVMEVMENEGEMKAATECMTLLFSEEDQKKIKTLKLKIQDYITLIMAAVSLALGEDPDDTAVGEQ